MSKRRGGLFPSRRDRGQRAPAAAPELWSYTAAGAVTSNHGYSGVSANDLIVASGKTLTVTGIALYVGSAGTGNGADCDVLIWDMAGPTLLRTVRFASASMSGYPVVAGTFRSQEITALALPAGTYRIAIYGVSGATAEIYNYNYASGVQPFTPETYGGNVSYGADGHYGGNLSGPPTGVSTGPNPYFVGAIVRGSIS